MARLDAERVARLLKQDLSATVGHGHEEAVDEAVARLRPSRHPPADFERLVVDEVQQGLHDAFVDTSWPACPEHPNHPLWYVDGWWTCKRSGRRVAPLGDLPAR